MDLGGAEHAIAKVLVVEDDPVSAMLVQRLLASRGLEMDVATDGLTALEMQRAHPYRMVISDWMMPGMDGVQLCREFRALGGAYVYFLLCSAKSLPAERTEAFNAGVDDFLSKPLDQAELFARIQVAHRILAAEDELNNKQTELARAVSNHQVAARRFQQLFNGVPVACFTFDAEGLIHEWNTAAEATYGMPAFEAFQQPVWQVFHHAPDLWAPAKIKDIFEAGVSTAFEWTFRDGNHAARSLACNMICLRGRNGESVGAVCASLDVTDRRVAEETAKNLARELEAQKVSLQEANVQLNHLAVTDGLTGLWNHRRFQEMLDEAMADYVKDGSPFSLLLLDIDHFKRFNDDFGHQIGDEVLTRFADVLRETARLYELPARYGGEEFAIILRHCNRMEATQAAERFRISIAATDWPHRGVTASIGVATVSPASYATKELVAQADSALYYSKQQGRNRVTHFDNMPASAAA